MRPAVAIGLAAVLALAGCAGSRGAVGVTDSEPVSTTTSGTAMSTTSTTASTAPAPDAAPLQCAGVDTTAPPTALPADAAVTAMTLCLDGYTYVPGSGDWSSWDTHVVPADRIAELTAALSQPTVVPAPDQVCDLMLVIVPTVTVARADGTTGLVQVPSDGCHPQENVRALLYDIVDTTAASVEPVALITDDKALRTGCLGAKPLTPSLGQAMTVAIPDGTLSACDYVTATDQDTTLRAANPVDGASVQALLAGLSPSPPTGCEPSPEVGDFVTVVAAPPATPADQRPPDSASGGPLFSVATSGCPVVVDGAWTILGWADPADVAALVAATGSTTTDDLPPVAESGCAGRPTDEQPRQLTADDAVTALVLCSDGAPQVVGGVARSTRETRVVPENLIPELAAALSVTRPPVPTVAVCPAYSMPVIVATTADGAVFTAAIPIDVCAPSAEVQRIVAEVQDSVPPVVEAVAPLR